jgi:hypothetical protein
MPTVSIARSDLFPVGTTVGIYPAASQRGGQTPAGGPPTSAVIATGVGIGAIGATPTPPTQSTRWRARVMQRRATAGTS